ncbi:ABC transporter substrate-binding protein [Clostridium sp. A1-XYC3]|uniref:ABC transporter substrate-binding protein n=1 Tax=Clostridium tanneri TaxID=3037988 RepID=A0ABU4JRM4_9CLOT|nr:ABC transporter substrate-binding protein [Clostridium sp. A1-XYC3]MDW8800616.1 ABC transporter substrate-binding protein [Clostridium sp. A1-XYC3]
MRRYIKILIVLFLISIITFMSACSSNRPASKDKETLEGKIVVLTDRRYEKQLKVAADNFEKFHKNVVIDIDVEDKSTEKISKEYMNNKERPIDVISVEDKSVQNLLYRFPDTFLDVTDDVSYLKDKISTGKFDNLTLKNRVYGLPLSSSPKVMLYRSDILGSLGINLDDIKTWKDYIDLGKKISKDTGKSLMTNIRDENSNLYYILANQLNTSYFDKDGKLNLSSEQWIKALEMVKLLYSEGTVYDLSHKDSIIENIKKDKIISFIADPLYVTDLIQYLPEQKGKWRAMKLPAFEAGGNRDVSVGGLNIMINKSSANLEIAKEFVKFAATDNRTQIEMMNSQGAFPVSTDIYNLVEFNKNNDYYNEKIWFLFSSVEKGSQGIKYVSNFQVLDESIKDALSIENLKSKDIKSIMDQLQKELENKTTIK